MQRRAAIAAVANVLLLLAVGLLAHADADLPRASTKPGSKLDLSIFNFARIQYASEGGEGEAYYFYDGRLWQRWETDSPDMDQNLSHRLGQLTRLTVNPHPTVRLLTAPDLGDFPFLFMSDPGWMVLTQEEKLAMRKYLKKGGIIWVDDFWGEGEWSQLANTMTEVLEGRQWRDITPEHPIFHTVFDVKVMPQIPALPFARPGGPTFENAGMHKYPMGSDERPHLRGWFDDNDRLMVICTHNTDFGDGYEREAYGQFYFETFSVKAYMMGTNIIAYAMTH